MGCCRTNISGVGFLSNMHLTCSRPVGELGGGCQRHGAVQGHAAPGRCPGAPVRGSLHSAVRDAGPLHLRLSRACELHSVLWLLDATAVPLPGIRPTAWTLLAALALALVSLTYLSVGAGVPRRCCASECCQAQRHLGTTVAGDTTAAGTFQPSRGCCAARAFRRSKCRGAAGGAASLRGCRHIATVALQSATICKAVVAENA